MNWIERKKRREKERERQQQQAQAQATVIIMAEICIVLGVRMTSFIISASNERRCQWQWRCVAIVLWLFIFPADWILSGKASGSPKMFNGRIFFHSYNVQFGDYQNDNIQACSLSRLLFFSFLTIFGLVWFGLSFILLLLKSHHARIFSYSVEFNLMKFHPIDYWWYSNALTKYVLAGRLPIK